MYLYYNVEIVKSNSSIWSRPFIFKRCARKNSFLAFVSKTDFQTFFSSHSLIFLKINHGSQYPTLGNLDLHKNMKGDKGLPIRKGLKTRASEKKLLKALQWG